MFETIITILIFFAVIAIAAILFGGWLVVMIVRAIGKLLWRPTRQPLSRLPKQLVGDATLSRCTNERCRAENAAVALFCRRCGTPIHAMQHVPVRRVAMW